MNVVDEGVKFIRTMKLPPVHVFLMFCEREWQVYTLLHTVVISRGNICVIT